MSEQNSEITETFCGVEIWDVTNTDNPYYTQIDIKHSVTPNFDVIVNKPVNAKYPTVIYPTKQNYLSGSATGDFSDNQTDTCNIDWTNTQFKLTFVEWLRNCKTKYLKLSDSLIIPVAITGITYDIETSIDDNFTTSVTFEWVQIGRGTTTEEGYTYCSTCNATLVPNANYCHMCGTAIS